MDCLVCIVVALIGIAVMGFVIPVGAVLFTAGIIGMAVTTH